MCTGPSGPVEEYRAYFLFLFSVPTLLVKHFDRFRPQYLSATAKNFSDPKNYQPLSLPALIPLNLKTTPRQRILAKNFMKTVE